MISNAAQMGLVSDGELRELTTAEIDEVGGGFVLLAAAVILTGCAVVAVYCTVKMAKQ